MSLQERRQDASASQAVEGIQYNRFVLRMHNPAGDAKPFFAKRQAATLRTVLDLGPLTVEEVRTKTGAIKYKFTARTVKLATNTDMKKIMRQINKELVSKGVLASGRNPNYYETNRDTINARRRARWAANRDAISAKRKAQYAEKQKLKVAMQALSENSAL